jgi:hypothetical protein
MAENETIVRTPLRAPACTMQHNITFYVGITLGDEYFNIFLLPLLYKNFVLRVPTYRRGRDKAVKKKELAKERCSTVRWWTLNSIFPVSPVASLRGGGRGGGFPLLVC